MEVLSAVTLAGGSLIDLDATFLVQLVIFFAVLILLHATVFKPMIALFEARKEAIEGARLDAKRMEKEAGEKADTFEDEMRKVRLEAGQERDRLRHDGIRLERQVVEKVRTETQQTLKAAEEKMALEAARIRGDMRDTIPQLARDMASRLLGREVS
jgi:F-type H+-transporting ATPase subunit b